MKEPMLLAPKDPVIPEAAGMETAQRTHAQNEGSLCLAWTSVLHSLYSNLATISVIPNSTNYIVTCHLTMTPPFASLMTGPTGPKKRCTCLSVSAQRLPECGMHMASQQNMGRLDMLAVFGCQCRVVGKANQHLPQAHHPFLSTIMLR